MTDPSAPCLVGYHGVSILATTKKTRIKAVIDFARETTSD